MTHKNDNMNDCCVCVRVHMCDHAYRTKQVKQVGLATSMAV